MKKSLLPIFAAAALFAGAEATSALDFTLCHGTMSADGAAVDSTYITDGDSKIFMRIPRFWKIESVAGALELIPDVPNSRIRFENVPGVKELPFDAPGKAALRQWMDKSLPDGARNVAALEDVDNPLPIFGWKDLELGRTYEFYGQAVTRSTMFLNMRPGRVVQVTITAPKDAYEKVHDAMRVLMFSWFEPSKDLPPDVARKLQDGTMGGS